MIVTKGRMKQFELQTTQRKSTTRTNQPMVMPVTYGRMGNFLFQAAASIAYALDHNLPFTMPDATTHPVNNPLYLGHLVDYKYDIKLPIHRIIEQYHTWHPLPKPNPGHNIILDGYWQTEKYFKYHRSKIIELFQYNDPNSQAKGVVSVHVRRGDYLTLTEKHPPVTKEWYEKAMSHFEGYQFLFHSDDIAWCEQTFGHRDDCDFSLNESPEDDLMSMVSCEHHICSASTFSWWGAWLCENPSKQIIMPRQWFQPGHGGHDTSDIVPKSWKRL